MKQETKIIIVIVVIAIIVAGIVGYLVLQKPDTQNKCGDGICDEKEKANPKLCFEDCREIISSYEDSPFGLQAPYSKDSDLSDFEETNFLLEIGIKWVRLLPTELGDISAELSKKNINILSGISPAKYNLDKDAYLEDVKSTVKKNKDYVDAWLLVNEADNTWTDTSEEYVEYFKLTSRAIKSEDPDSKIILSLAGGQNDAARFQKSLKFFDIALKNGIAPYFDVLDFHVQGADGEYKNLTIKTAAFRNVFKENGLEEKPIWITEYGTYDGDPTADHEWQLDFPYQSEKSQARELVKKYVYGISLNVDKMFWTTMVEWYKYNNNTNSYFSNVGLINNPKTDGKSNKKLAYYSYKLMTEKLEGSDWDNIQTIQESNDVYIYKFLKNGRLIWVAWNDEAEKQITIFGISSNNVKITEAVSKYETGQEVTDYNTAFNTQTKTVNNGQVSLNLENTPVFVEEI